MRAAAIVQARMASTRFPGKITNILPTGRTVFEEVLFRAQAIPGLDMVIAAISDKRDSDPLVTLAQRARMLRQHHHRIWKFEYPGSVPPRFYYAPIVICRGSEDDVLRRYLMAAQLFDVQHIMRITSDCPLIDPDVCAEVLRAYFEERASYACNNNPGSWPHGYDCEVFSRMLLEEADRIDPRDAEHVTGWMRFAPGIQRVNIEKEGENLYQKVRWTLDYPEDLWVIEREFRRRIHAMCEKVAA